MDCPLPGREKARRALKAQRITTASSALRLCVPIVTIDSGAAYRGEIQVDGKHRDATQIVLLAAEWSARRLREGESG
jgi:hypothetical protein